MVPLIKEFQKYPNIFNIKVCVTAQHREMLDQVLHLFKITPDYDMNIMKSGQDLYDITSNVLLKMKSVLEEYQPDLVFVHGEHVLRRGTGGFLSADTRRPSGGRAAHRRHLLPLARRGQPPAHYADHRLPLRLHGDLESHPPQENVDDQKIVVTGHRRKITARVSSTFARHSKRSRSPILIFTSSTSTPTSRSRSKSCSAVSITSISSSHCSTKSSSI